MMIRAWRGRTVASDADSYECFLRETAWQSLKRWSAWPISSWEIPLFASNASTMQTWSRRRGVGRDSPKWRGSDEIRPCFVSSNLSSNARRTLT